MKLHFLGTGSSYPTVTRGVSSAALQLDNGCVWLFDCGEGTQIQVQKVSVSRQRITDIFITHLHGDHLFGLPGLLCTISSQMSPVECTKGSSNSVVNIYGPEGVNRFITTALAVSYSPLAFKFKVHELVPEPEQYPEDLDEMKMDSCILTPHPNQLPGTRIKATKDHQGNATWLLRNDKLWHVEAGWIHHRVPTFGFVVREKERPGTLNKEKVLALGVPPGPLYGQLKQGMTVTTVDGKTVSPEEVLGPPIPGRTLVILGDTKDASPITHLVQECDVVVHESTHDNSFLDKAMEFGHSTPAQAVAFAKNVGAKTLLLNHFSQRYAPASSETLKQEARVSLLEEQAREAAAGSALQVQCVEDLFVFDIPSRSRDK